MALLSPPEHKRRDEQPVDPDKVPALKLTNGMSDETRQLLTALLADDWANRSLTAAATLRGRGLNLDVEYTFDKS